MKRRPVFRIDANTGDDLDPSETLPSADPLPEDAYLSAERAEIIQRLLNRLPEPFRQVIRLVDLEGMDYQEAANVLGLPLGTVKSRLARARLKMRALLLPIRWL